MKSALVVAFKAFVNQVKQNKLDYCKAYIEKVEKPTKKKETNNK